MIIGGAISITNMQKVEEHVGPYQYCFMIRDNEQDGWQLCADDQNDYENWVCKIKKVAFRQNCYQKDDEEIELKQKVVIRQPIYIITRPSPYCNENKDFSRKGEDWECLCKDGN